MLYLIKSSGYKEEEGKISIFFLLKIGYTEDSRKDKRFLQYKLHNPTCQVLYEIPGATEDHEKRVQYKFRNLLFEDYGREWFIYSEEIIEFFKNIKSLEDIENRIPKGNSSNSKYLKYKNKVKEILKYISDIPCRSKEFRELCEEIFDILGDKVKDEGYVIEYLMSRFGESQIEKYLKIENCNKVRKYCEDDLINQEAVNFLEEYNSITEARKKLIFLCEAKLSKSVIDIVLNQIPDSDYIKTYYLSLGPEKLRNLGYKRNNIEKELGIVTFSDELLYDSVYSNFKVGEKYLFPVIKERLRDIYSSINYKSTPKANDIEKYFEVKDSMCRVEVNGEKKRVRYYELLKSKEQDLRLELKHAQ